MDGYNGNYPFHIATIEKSLENKTMIPLDFTTHPMEWQCYFGYCCLRPCSGSPIYHTQDYYELIVHLRSGRKYAVNDIVFQADFGDVLIFPPDRLHRGITVRDAVCECYYLYFHPQLFAHIPGGEQLLRVFRRPNLNLISFQPPERDRILDGLGAFQNAAALTPLDRISLQAAVLDLLVRLNRRADEVGDSVPLQSAAPPMMTAIVQYINAEYASIATIESVAGKFGISRAHMSRLFRKELQISPYQYLQSVRLTEAQSLLKKGAGVTEACYRVGFNDCSRFITYFKRTVGMTPGEYLHR